jgi:putative transport protein
LIIVAVASVGLLVGSVRIRGIGLGPAGVLFSGIVFGHLGVSIPHDISVFAKEFGLVLFVFTIGLQLGPGIVHLWKQQGLVLNCMAAAIVAQGVLLAVGLHGLLGIPVPAAAGLFSGATTNTPSLGAAQQAAVSLGASPDSLESLSAAYAVAYPGGVIGIIVSMLVLKKLFRIDTTTESNDLQTQADAKHAPIRRRSITVDNRHLVGVAFGNIPGLEETGVRISRIRRQGENEVHPATAETELRVGDVIQIVGTENELGRFAPLVGQACPLDLMTSSGDAEFRRIVVTEPGVLNTPLSVLSLDKAFNATVTRIRRSGVEMTARGSSRFHYGDIAHVVGDHQSLDGVTAYLGNSVKSLDETRFVSVFAGITLGVIVGILPFHVPGIPFPIHLGLAGGPLLAAILLSLVGNVGSFVWYVPYSANLALRELGIILFLACAGLGAGETFFTLLMSVNGLAWILAGLALTTIPLLTVGIAMRLWFKFNFLLICGVIAGSMTDPPALAFANKLSAESDACSAVYAAVYPLTMILRIIAAQALIYLLL